MREIQFIAANGDGAGGMRLVIVRTALQIVGALRARSTGSYRPEKHYMRGAGPKAREKQQDAFRSPQS